MPRKTFLPLLSTALLPSIAYTKVKIPVRSAAPPPEASKSRWTFSEKRTGLLAIKKGMMSMWDPWARRVPVTVLQLDNTCVIGHRTKERHGRDGMLIGCRKIEISTEELKDKYKFQIRASRSAKLGFCIKHMVEFPVTPSAFVPVGNIRAFMLTLRCQSKRCSLSCRSVH